MTDTSRVLVCGDRNWSDKALIRGYLAGMKIDVVIEGEARGADRFGFLVARELRIDVLPFPAKWDEYGRAAGVIRNQQMLDEGKPTLVLAFHDNIYSSKGTKDMVKRANKANIPVWLISGTNERGQCLTNFVLGKE